MNLPRPLFASTLALALAAAPAWAQATDNESTEGGPLEGAAAVAPSAKNGPTHTVEKGDTLWDLSQKFLGSPWYWPKVWSYNPEIANPHWIYPGNQVRFIATGEEVPTQVEVGTGPEEDVQQGELIDDGDKVQVAGKIGFQPKSGVSLRLEGFVTPKEVEEAGVIAGSFAETEMISFPQQLYVRFKKGGAVKMGEVYVIYRTAKEVTHPVTHSDFGYLTHVVGSAKVVRWSEKEKVASLEIVGEWDEIHRGDLVGPASENFFKLVSEKPNAKEVKGAYIISSGRHWFSTFAEHEQMLIDRGSEQGVEVGNVFTVYRQMDPETGDPILHPEVNDDTWPKEDIGTCLAVEVKGKATTCILTRSIREIVRGDRVEMRTKAPGGPSAMR